MTRRLMTTYSFTKHLRPQLRLITNDGHGIWQKQNCGVTVYNTLSWQDPNNIFESSYGLLPRQFYTRKVLQENCGTFAVRKHVVGNISIQHAKQYLAWLNGIKKQGVELRKKQLAMTINIVKKFIELYEQGTYHNCLLVFC